MRYLFVINTMNVGGAEKGLVELMNQIVSENNEVDLFLTYKTGLLLEKIDPKIRVNSLVDKERILHSLVGLLSFGVTLLGFSFGYKLFITEDYDYEIAYLEGFPSLFVSKSSKSNIKISSVRVDLRGHRTILDFLPWGKRIQEKMYTSFDGVHCVSDSVKESFDSIYPNCASKSFTIKTGFDIEKIIRESNLINPFYDKEFINFVVVGRLEPQKGHDKLFEALKLLDVKVKEKVRVHIIGNYDTSFGRELSSRYKELIDNGLIILHGQKENPYPYIKFGNVVVSVSNREGFPRVVNEALILGKPVLATDIPSNREALQDGKFGLLIDNSVAGIKQGLETCLRKDFIIELEQRAQLHKVYDLKQYAIKFKEKLRSLKDRRIDL